MSRYTELLKDPRWQRRRLEILNRADFSCEECGDTEKTLHVHHKLYRKGAMPWEYEDHELEALCEDCHDVQHRLREALNVAIATMSQGDLEVLLGCAEAIAATNVLCEQPGAEETAFPVRSFEHATGLMKVAAPPLPFTVIQALADRGTFQLKDLALVGEGT